MHDQTRTGLVYSHLNVSVQSASLGQNFSAMRTNHPINAMSNFDVCVEIG